MAIKFIGRDSEIDRLTRDIGRGFRGNGVPTVTCVYGPTGIGKSAFLEFFWERISSLQIPSVCIRAKVPAEGADVRAWLEAITPDIRASHPAIQKRLVRFRHAFAQKMAYLDHGTRPPFDPQRPDAALFEWWLTELCVNLIDPDQKEGRRISQVRLFWYLDDFERWPPICETWFGVWLPRVFKAHAESCEQRFFTVLEKEPAAVTGFKAIWERVGEVTAPIELAPFSKQQTAAFLESANLPADQLDHAYETTGGVPGRLAEYLDSQSNAGSEQEVSLVEGVFKGKSQRENQFILWAAHLRWFSREFLRFFAGSTTGDDAFAYLKLRLELELTPTSGGYQVSGAVADALTAWHKQRQPEEYEAFERRAQICMDLFHSVGNAADLGILSLLARFRFFNNQLIEQILPTDSKTVRLFIKANPHFFYETEHNQAVADPFRSQFNEYNSLVAHPQERELREKIQNAWNERRDGVLREMHEIDESIQREEKTLEGISEELSKMNADNRAKRFDEKLTESPDVKVQFAGPSPAGGLSVFCLVGVLGLILGVIFLYMGILFADHFSMTYCAVGVMCLVVGLSVPYRRRPQPRSAPIAAVSKPRPKAPPPPPSDSNQRLLNMKLTNLENKRSLIIESLARQRQRLAELDSLLCEPYANA
ncbi:MAG: AAA family ATPase [Opitutales bacterium]